MANCFGQHIFALVLSPLMYFGFLNCNERLRKCTKRHFLAWGARGREFESRHADQQKQGLSSHKGLSLFYFMFHYENCPHDCPHDFVGYGRDAEQVSYVNSMNPQTAVALCRWMSDPAFWGLVGGITKQ